jgi:hypothetical protein
MVFICLDIVDSPSIYALRASDFVLFLGNLLWVYDYRFKYHENGRNPVVTNGRYAHAECHHEFMTTVILNK